MSGLQMEATGELGKPKPVHRIAFFSRLDERKGIKLFVEAVSLLPHHKRPDFEVGGRTQAESRS